MTGETDDLNHLEYVMLNVEHNLWVAGDEWEQYSPLGFISASPAPGIIIPPGFTNDLGKARRILRMPALQRFVDTFNRGSGYEIPVRIVDIVMVAMGVTDDAVGQ